MVSSSVFSGENLVKNVTLSLAVITFNACTYSRANIVGYSGNLLIIQSGLIQHNCGVLIITCGGDDVAQRKAAGEDAHLH